MFELHYDFSIAFGWAVYPSLAPEPGIVIHLQRLTKQLLLRHFL